MSLLLDALKKAEKAKEEAKRQHPPSAATFDDTILQVRTRDELPDVSKPIEIHTEDIATGLVPDPLNNPVPDAFSTAPTAHAVSTPPRSSPKIERAPETRAPQSSRAEPDVQSTQRAAAKQVFDAKYREPNPKLPFYITVAVLGAFAIGTVVYFWYQLRPPPPLVNTNPKPPADEKKVDALPVQGGDKTTAAPASPNAPGAILELLPEATTQPPAGLALPSRTLTNPGTNLASGASATKAAPVQASARPTTPQVQQSANRTQESAPAPRRRNSTSPGASAPESSKLSVNRPAAGINPKIESGWLAYNRGDLTSARSSYVEMLRDEPTNRDALLGMAAVEVRANRQEQAAVYYQTLLQINPRDPYAQAGLLALRSQVIDPVQTESRVKSLLASDPEAQILYFSLGNQYAQQGRWPEAQQAYFKAYTAEPENPDFAYNLAVSLDQVRQPKLALEYYRRAISLAQQRSSSFDQTLARNRVQDLTR